MSVTSLLPYMSTLSAATFPEIATRVRNPPSTELLLFQLVEGLVLTGLAVLVIAVLWWVVKRYLPSPPSKDLLTRLDENAISGKITPDDYVRIRAELMRTHAPQASPDHAPVAEDLADTDSSGKEGALK